jgi:hypothetical protein
VSHYLDFFFLHFLLGLEGTSLASNNRTAPLLPEPPTLQNHLSKPLLPAAWKILIHSHSPANPRYSQACASLAIINTLDSSE